MAEPVTQTSISREAPFLEDYRRRLLESTFKRGDQPMPSERRGIADFDMAERAAFNFGAGQMGIDPATGKTTAAGLTAARDPFMTPFQQQVIDATKASFENKRLQERHKLLESIKEKIFFLSFSYFLKEMHTMFIILVHYL